MHQIGYPPQKGFPVDGVGVSNPDPIPKTHNRSLQIWSNLFLCLQFSSPKHAVPGYFCPYQSQLTADSQPEVFIVYYNDCLKVIMIEGLSIMPHDFRNFEL